MKKLLFAVPKGRILDELNPLFKKAGIIPEDDFFNDSSRKIIFSTNHQNLEMIKVRSFDVATFVKFGGADLGVCGSDVLEEFPSNEVFSVLDLKIGKCRLSLAGSKNAAINSENLLKNSHLRIATKYPNLVNRHFAGLGIQAETVKLNGAIEIAPQLGLCDFIVDLVSSGKTLVENNMVELQKILDVTSRLIVNRASFKVSNREINQLIKSFDAAI
jgi:ATP phosphoribosyltransferase